MTDLGNSPAARDIASVLHPYTNLAVHREKGPMIIERGKGIYVYDDSGKEYIEGLAGLWCTALGFGVEELVEAAAEQMRKLPYYHIFASKSTGPAIDLADRLTGMLPIEQSKIFFANSGSEANDSLIKMVWYYSNARGLPDKKKIISRQRAYHGVTIASASLTGLPFNHRSFDLPIDRILHTDCPHYYHGANNGESEEEFSSRLANNLDEMIINEGPETVAAFIAEPVMGAGGVVVPPAGYFEKIQAVLAKHDVMFLDDEVICGFGRTGNPFGCQTFGIKPDTITIAKALSSAYLPISAVAINNDMFEGVMEESNRIGVFGHGFTYSGHPVAAAVALKNLELMEEWDVMGHAARVSPTFQARLNGLSDHPLVGEARGVGLVGAIELIADKSARRNFQPTQGVGAYLSQCATDAGLIIRAMGDNIGLCPPLIITEAEINEMFDRLTSALNATEEWVDAGGLRTSN
ncbi:MAG: aspartate aminotransferase family protein [Alphaproteobacteria bacterium]|jgi:4-aminobutyrate---pyruvate transaminase|nr:aspartate aminotransferase family protein [Alphaproteobacteria bacterium]MBT4086130.1 aspartate aminotransferase family protein [Alphaproteobacteria bacterium]MBT4543747.1 aspartate aminotransferase family protein [Alphaproteobacteria bacterium]MBT7743992.1 aspartate aminotransferase family protein [Alphaproteobacteria bacterium]